jgi:hypothetical protein
MTSRIKREAVSHKGLGGKEGNFGRKGLEEGLTMRYTAGQMMDGRQDTNCQLKDLDDRGES